MKLVLISSPHNMLGETDYLNRMFESGLEYFHLRKPEYNERETENFLRRINPVFHSRIVLHYYHELISSFSLGGTHLSSRMRKKKLLAYENSLEALSADIERNKTVSASFHSLETMRHYGCFFKYVFISPVYDSISKKSYKARFKQSELKAAIQTIRQLCSVDIVALGGVNEDKIHASRHTGFHGVAIMGAVWQDKNPIQKFQQIYALCQKAGLTC